MDTERTVAATVKKLIRALDDEAGLEALMQLSESRRRGDLESEDFWLSVYAAMEVI